MAAEPSLYQALAVEFSALVASTSIPVSIATLQRMERLCGGALLVVFGGINADQPFSVSRLDVLQQWIMLPRAAYTLPPVTNGVPLLANGYQIGMLLPPAALDATTTALLAPLLASEIERWRSAELQHLEAARRTALGRIATTANAHTDLVAMLREVYGILYGPLQFQGFLAAILDAQREETVLMYIMDTGEETVQTDRQAIPNNLSGYIMRQRVALRFDDLMVEVQHYPGITPLAVGTGASPHAWLGVPMQLGDGTVVGMLSVQSYDATHYAERDQRFLEQVATTLAVAVQKVLLLNERDAQLAQITNGYEQQRLLLALVRELGSPVMPIYGGVLAVPLVGTLDSERMQMVMERLLEAIVREQADVVIMDITGVPMVDTAAVNYLLQAAAAVRLLGSQIILTGISGAIAQTMVQLGVSLGDITTRANLAAGLEEALTLVGRRIT